MATLPNLPHHLDAAEDGQLDEAGSAWQSTPRTIPPDLASLMRASIHQVSLTHSRECEFHSPSRLFQLSLSQTLLLPPVFSHLVCLSSRYGSPPIFTDAVQARIALIFISIHDAKNGHSTPWATMHSHHHGPALRQTQLSRMRQGAELGRAIRLSTRSRPGTPQHRFQYRDLAAGTRS